MNARITVYALPLALWVAGCATDKSDNPTTAGTPTGVGVPTGASTGTATGGTTPGSTSSGAATGTATGTPAGTPGGTPPGTTGGATTGGTPGGTPTAVGLWYMTCGDPVCSGYSGPFPGVPLCSLAPHNEGDPCWTPQLGSTCDPVDYCDRLLVCATSDPTMQPGGCPISLAEHKEGIAYVSDVERHRLSEVLLGTRLATWRYRGELDDGRTHLGFLIDDAPLSPAVRPDGGHVDLYGYTSLTVAAIQEQQRELDALRAEVQALKKACASR